MRIVDSFCRGSRESGSFTYAFCSLGLPVALFLSCTAMQAAELCAHQGSIGRSNSTIGGAGGSRYVMCAYLHSRAMNRASKDHQSRVTTLRRAVGAP